MGQVAAWNSPAHDAAATSCLCGCLNKAGVLQNWTSQSAETACTHTALAARLTAIDGQARGVGSPCAIIMALQRSPIAPGDQALQQLAHSRPLHGHCDCGVHC